MLCCFHNARKHKRKWSSAWGPLFFWRFLKQALLVHGLFLAFFQASATCTWSIYTYVKRVCSPCFAPGSQDSFCFAERCLVCGVFCRSFCRKPPTTSSCGPCRLWFVMIRAKRVSNCYIQKKKLCACVRLILLLVGKNICACVRQFFVLALRQLV